LSKHKNSPLQSAVMQAYSAAAEHPQGEHPFPMGREFATSLGYPPDLLAQLPSVSVSVFAGVSNVSVFADIPQGATVLDLGCGAGFDSLIAAKRTGASGRVIGIDFSEAMLRRARQGVSETGTNNVEFYRADADDLTIADGQIDVALVNGIFNLNPDREGIFRELARVMRPGGAVYSAELILRESLPPEVKQSETNWFA
jgi:arsenite methyltransferase